MTLTIGGNDLLGGFFERSVGDRAEAREATLGNLLSNLDRIGKRLTDFRCPTILNTIYDPTDGDDRRAADLGLVSEARYGLQAANEAIRALAASHGFYLCDLESLFLGHGFWSDDPWIVMHIEPNLAGATRIAEKWHEIYLASRGA